jgi:hypothetical protein
LEGALNFCQTNLLRDAPLNRHWRASLSSWDGQGRPRLKNSVMRELLLSLASLFFCGCFGGAMVFELIVAIICYCLLWVLGLDRLINPLKIMKHRRTNE